jgi:membrane protein
MASNTTRWLEGLVIRLRRWATLLWREIRTPARPVLRAITLWLDADGLRMSAAMSFYGILSLAPLVALLVSVLGRWLDMERLEANLLARVSAGMGQQAADVVQQALGNAFARDGNLISFLTFLVFASGALGVFAELLSAFERLWRQDRPDMPSVPWWNSVKLHLRGMLYILVMGGLLLLSLLAAALMTVFTDNIPFLAAMGWMLPALNELLSFVFCTALFIGLMRLSTGPKPDLRHVAWGAVVGAVLFSGVRHALARYLTSAPIVNAYGAAGSMVAVLMWFYVTSAILLFAAAWARALADESRLRHGS